MPTIAAIGAVGRGHQSEESSLESFCQTRTKEGSTREVVMPRFTCRTKHNLVTKLTLLHDAENSCTLPPLPVELHEVPDGLQYSVVQILQLRANRQEKENMSNNATVHAHTPRQVLGNEGYMDTNRRMYSTVHVRRGRLLVLASLLAEVWLVMETAGLGERLPAVLAFGIESVEDFANDALVSDTARREGYGRMGGVVLVEL